MLYLLLRSDFADGLPLYSIVIYILRGQLLINQCEISTWHSPPMVRFVVILIPPGGPIQLFLISASSGVGRCQKVCVCWGGGGGGGTHRHVIYVPSVKNQYKRVLFGYMVIY